MKLPFDSIVLITDDGRRWLTVEQYEKMPLTLRLRALFEKRLLFYSGSAPIDPHDALSAMRARAVHAHGTR